MIDPSYQTNLYRLINWPNPTFPAYPSRHSCFSSASARLFIDFFGDQTQFVDRSHEDRIEFRGQPRSFKRFDEMAEECGYSRIPLGVHLRMDCTEDLRLGYEISDAINRYHLKKPKYKFDDACCEPGILVPIYSGFTFMFNLPNDILSHPFPENSYIIN